jgi:hypothetical protein
MVNKKPTNALILQCSDTRHFPTCFGTLKYHHQEVNHDPAEIGAQCCRNQRWLEAVCCGRTGYNIQLPSVEYQYIEGLPATIHSFQPSLICRTLGTYLSRIMIDSLIMAF